MKKICINVALDPCHSFLSSCPITGYIHDIELLHMIHHIIIILLLSYVATGAAVSDDGGQFIHSSVWIETYVS
jgi:hypothetical protein